jgi:signal transduction histidine kinase
MAAGGRPTQCLAAAFLVLLLCTFVLPVQLHAVENPLQKILILHSYHRGHKWTDDQHAGLEAALKNDADANQIYVEYMDANRMDWGRDFETLYDVYHRKYAHLKFDVICTTDGEAFQFVRMYGDRLFRGTPVVFSGINYVKLSDLAGTMPVTGVNEEADLRANIELILRLHPRTKQIVFINESTPTGQRVRDEFSRVIPSFEKSIDFLVLDNVDTRYLLSVVGALPSTSIILYGAFGRDAAGRIFDYREIISLIARSSPVPIYSPWDFNLGHGIVGGVMTTGYSQGEAAGRLASRVLHGGRTANIPVVMASPKAYLFDYERLKHFRIAKELLPRGSTLINHPESFVERYRRAIAVVTVTIVGLLAVITVLTINIRQRKVTEAKLKASRTELRGLAWRLAEAEDAERKRISRELHDEIGQNLTLLGLNLSVLKSVIGREKIDGIGQRMSDSVALVKQTTERVRNLMNKLRSPVLDDYGLGPAMDLYARQWTERTGINLIIRSSAPAPRLPAPVENALFRIFQESLTNVVKHADASQVIVTTTAKKGTFVFSIEDNGRGYDTMAGGQRGWGLIGMKERAEAVSGTCRIRSGPGLGTHVTVEVPL